MAKPTNIPRWGETGGGTPGANNTEPASGTKDTGYVPGTPSIVSYLNWLLWVLYKWIEFLNPLFTSGGGFLAATNQNVGVQGTGVFAHPSRTLVIAGGAGVGNIDPALADAPYVVEDVGLTNVSGSTLIIFYPIPLPAGVRLTSVKAHLTTSATVGYRQCRLVEGDFIGGSVDVDREDNTTASSDVTLDALDPATNVDSVDTYTLLSTKHYIVSLFLRDNDVVRAIEITYDVGQ